MAFSKDELRVMLFLLLVIWTNGIVKREKYQERYLNNWIPDRKIFQGILGLQEMWFMHDGAFAHFKRREKR